MRKLNFSEIKAFQEDQLSFVQRMTEDLGGVAHVNMMGINLFFISEPAVIREVLIHCGDKLHRDPFTSRVFSRFMGNGVFMAEGDDWRRQRKLVQPAFHATRIRDYTEIIANATDQMVNSWQPGQIVIIDEVLTQLTLRIIAKTMFDVDLVDDVARIGLWMKEILTVGEAQLKMPILPPQWLPTPGNRRQQAALRAVKSHLRQIIAQRAATGEDRGDLLSMLLNARDEEGDPMPEDQLLDECVTLFVAGHETTAAALTWTWYLLAQHPHVMAQLRAELDGVLGERQISFADLNQLPYLEAVVKETLRLYPPAFGFGRQVMRPFDALGYHFPRKAVLLFSSYATHRRPDLWSEPEAFRPERFLDTDNSPDRYTYFPFGVGSRICLGNMFAMLEAQVILASMLQRIELTRVDHDPVVMDTLITLRPRDSLRMQVSMPQLA
ncbi:cytochrome P450 [bacterium]|nr:cytochrome P450 [bacterium]